MPAVDYTRVEAQVRDALGGVDTGTVPSSVLTVKMQNEVARMLGTYLCVGDGAGGLILTEPELSAFYEAAGKFAAASYVTSPAARQTLGYLSEILRKIGRMERRFTSWSSDGFASELRGAAASALRRIACVAAGLGTARLALSGADRSGETLLDQAFGRDPAEEEYTR